MDAFLRSGRKVAPKKAIPNSPENDILLVTVPFVRFCFAMGLVPFRPSSLWGQTEEKRFSKLHLSYSVIIFSGFTALFCAVIQSRVTGRSSDEGTTIKSTVYMAWWLLSGLVSVASFSTLIARRVELQDNLMEMAKIASKVIPKGKKFLGRIRYLLYAEVATVLTLVAASGGLMYYGIMNEQLPPESYEVVFHLFSLGATLVMSLQFINQLFMLHQLLSLVNAELIEIRNSFKVASKNRRNVDHSSELFRDNDALPSRIRRNAYYHFTLCHLGPRLNEIYGILALLLAMFVLLDVAFQFYLLINSAITGVTREVVLYQLGTILLWSLPKVVTLILLVAACEFVANEADSTGVLVSEVLLKIKDHEARRELRLFSHQLLHTKVRFTACGFFTLDFSLLTSMTAAVVTHLVILVQFQLAGKDGSACNCTYSDITDTSISIPTEVTSIFGE